MTRRTRATFAAFAAACFGLAGAQDTTVQCTYADWTTNARGQNPCLAWAELQTKCDAGGVRVTPLANYRYHYTQPDSESEINDCNCSVVAYNLMAACTWCQLGLDNKWINETLWRSNCPSYNARGLSIDTAGLTIPEWAKIPVDGGMWRPNIASLAATPPTVTPTLASATSTPQSTADTHTNYPRPKGGNNAGAIAGGVVGAALIVILFAALFIFFIRRSKRRAEIEARLRSSRRSSRSRASRTRPTQTKLSSSPPDKPTQLAETPSMPAVPEMAYHPRCNHGIVSLAAASSSPRASMSTAVDEGSRTPPAKSPDQMV
ncbi:unnamed protein product [Rhizoctonia solani]|uniref:Transmembrane protein n=2 Tax=Rhizoctonia solani TaxID=456999 RepID=A0A8H2XJ91_9AGAM|nr:transmembrane protein, putative [Rhizoctonia solani AG-3 Rhs1AP]CAE6415672.1 unnamed protein product [Rhizoctonia solani]CAE6428074.1 unnamed protein product [Rhizoctonia solani]